MTKGQRKAIIVANDQYDNEGLTRLRSPVADAQALAEVLGDPHIGEFDVQVIHNEAAHVIQAHIEELFSEGRQDDVLLVHFSCHGLKSESGELFFAARNTRPNRLGSTAISADFIQRCMRASRSRRVVLFLDCCYGGAFSQGVAVRAAGDIKVLDSFPSGGLGAGRGRAVITASSAMEYAFEDEVLAEDHERRPSVFTSALVAGLATGDADRDEDGWVSLNELYDYVFDRVREQTPHQTPSRDVEMQGELYLARSRRRRIKPVPIPPELEAARTAADTYTRLGAVTELASLLGADNVEAAIGAYEALLATARADMRRVADAAEAALRQADVQLAETALEFAPVARDSGPPHRVVKMLGPPVARSCTARSSDERIRVREAGGDIDISIETAEGGSIDGFVTVSGPTGEAVIAVTAKILPEQSHPPRRSGQPKPQRIRLTRPASRRPSRRPEAHSPADRRPASRQEVEKGKPDRIGLPATSSLPTTAGATPVNENDGHREPVDRQIGRALWSLLPILSFSILAPVPIIHAAIKLKKRNLWWMAAGYVATWLALWIALISGSVEGDTLPGIAFVALIVLAIGTVVQAFHVSSRILGHKTGDSQP